MIEEEWLRILRAQDQCLRKMLEALFRGPDPTVVVPDDRAIAEAPQDFYLCCSRCPVRLPPTPATPQVSSSNSSVDIRESAIAPSSPVTPQSPLTQSFPGSSGTPTMGSPSGLKRKRQSGPAPRKSDDLKARLRHAITAWVGSVYESGSQDISAMATGRDGIISYEHIDTIVRLALRLDRSVQGEDFASLLKMMPDPQLRETLSGMLRRAVKIWDELEKQRRRRECEAAVKAYDAAEERKEAWLSDPANRGRVCPPEIDILPKKPVSDCGLHVMRMTNQAIG